jgi:hypothetical protein
MPRPKLPKNNDPFKDLPPEFKDAIAASSPEEIRKRICEVALNEEENQRLKAEDQDLAEKKEAAKLAGEQYSDGTKSNRLKIKFMRRCLEDKGAL